MKVINFEKENQIQPLFLGESLGVQKYLSPQHPKLEALTVRQMEYFWRPERHAANIAQDNLDYPNLTESERHVFLSNIQYQIVLDTIQGRAIIPALMPFVSCDELESCITAWQFFENIHSRSYSFILKNVLPQPEDVFDGIDKVQEIIERSNDICNQYEELITYAIQYSERTSYSEKIPLDKDELDTLKTSIYLTLISINILEGVRFYTSFACSFALAENNKMLGTGKILSEISRDEACLTGDHEVLTEKGWKRLDALDKTELVAQYTKDKEIEFVRPTGYVDKYYEGDLYTYKNQKGHYEFEMTADHRVIWRDAIAKTIEENVASEFRPACSKQVIACGLKKGGDIDTLSPVDRLRIAVQADGHLHDQTLRDGSISGYHTLSLRLTRDRKKFRIEQLIKELPDTFKHKVSPVKDNLDELCYRFWVPIEYNISKDFEWVDLTRITGNWAREFVTELAYWDGHLRYGDLSNIYYSTCRSDVADSVQAIAALSGWRCFRGIQVDNRKESYSDIHRLTILPDKDFYSAGTPKNMTKAPYSGRVYCVEVPSGMFLVRKNNKVGVTGNCHLQITQYLINTLQSNKDWQHITQSPQVRSQVESMYRSAVQQEEDWSKYLFSKGCLLGLNEAILSEFIKWICNMRTDVIGYGKLYPESKSNPITWILRHLGGAETQSALQETVTNTYLEGGGLDLTKPLDFSSKKRKFSL